MAYTHPDFPDLSYCADTGEFTWLKTRGSKRVSGQAAGSNNKKCINICHSGKKYKAHRLAFLFVNGEWPKKDVDHINGNPLDNRFSNLRDVDNSVNRKNSKLYRTNRNGHPGVHKTPSGSWWATIQSESKQHYLGTFGCYTAALLARKKMEVLLGFHHNHGRVVND